MKCSFCGKQHSYYLTLDPKDWRPDQRKSLPFKKKMRVASDICQDCEKLINRQVLGKVNKIVNSKLKGIGK